MTIAPADSSLLRAAVELAPRIRAAADQTEAERRLPSGLVTDMARAGLFRLCVPAQFGGGEVDVATMLRAIEITAEADGAAGWCVTIGASTGVTAAYLREDAAREIYGRDPDVVTGGVFAPRGKAVSVEGGYRVSGRWAFASGIEHCAWRMGGCLLFDDGTPRMLPNGLPDARMMIFPAEDSQVIDTWSVAGLRGTGSHDLAVQDIFVPAERSVSLVTDRPVRSGPLYAFPVFGLLALGIAAVATGMARGAIDEFSRLAGAKTPTGSRKLLADRPLVQMQVAQAEATLRAARTFLFDTVEEVWQAAVAAGAITVAQRGLLRLAATHATVSSAQVVDLMYNAGGATSIYDSSPLQRYFRDIHVATQHLMVAPPTYELVGRLFLNLETDTSML